MNYEGIKGLTADDRAEWEKSNIKELTSGGYYNLSEPNKNKIFKSWAVKAKYGHREDYDSIFKNLSGEKLDSIYNTIGADDPIEQLDEYQQVHEESSYNTVYKQGGLDNRWAEFDKMLTESLKTYRDWGNTEYLWLKYNQEEKDKLRMQWMQEYDAESAIAGENAARQNLFRKVQNTISSNQPLMDRINNAIGGFGATLTGAVISALGSVASLFVSPVLQAGDFLVRNLGDDADLEEYNKLFGTYYSNNRNFFEQYVIDFVNNPWSRYGNKVRTTGTLLGDTDSERNRYEIIRPYEEIHGDLWDKIASTNTVFELGQQAGFTAAAMLEGAGAGSMIRYAAKEGAEYVAKKAAKKIGTSMANNIASREMLNTSLQTIANAERIADTYITPAFVGTLEGAVNALDTQQKVLKQSQNQLNDYLNGLIEKRYEELLKSTPINEEVANNPQLLQLVQNSIYSKAESEIKLEYAKEIEDAENRAVYNSQTALMTDLLMNSVVNGFVNKYLQYTQLGSKVKESVQRTAVGKLFEGGKYSIDASGNVIAKEISALQKAGKALKEPLGEMLEEGFQEISSAGSSAGSAYDFNNYLNQRFNGVAEDAIVDYIGESFLHAFKAMGESAVSRETIEAGIYGALGSMGGNINVNTILSPIETTKEILSKEGLLGKGKAFLDAIYRNPMIESWRESNAENDNRKKSEKALNDWLNKDGNKEKFNSIKGILGWVNSMTEAEKNGDEFNYRNSSLGVLVSNYFLLEQLKGTEFYNSWMEYQMKILNAKEGSDIAEEISKYDDRPLEEIKASVQKSLDLMTSIQEVTADLERSFGNTLPQHVKESLIFGKLSMQDWKDRGKKVEEEINGLDLNFDRIFAGDSELLKTKSFGLSEEQKHEIARTGTLGRNPYSKAVEELEARISVYERNKKALTEKQKEEYKSLKKVLAETKKKEKKQEEKSKKSLESISEGQQILLSAQEIMQLSPSDRYFMLNPKNRKKFSEEQRQIIERLETLGNNANSSFMTLIEDAARIENAQIEYLNKYNEALKDPRRLDYMNRVLEYQSKLEDKKKEYKALNEIKTYEEFVDAVDNIIYEGLDNASHQALRESLKDNPFYSQYTAELNVVNALTSQLLSNDNLKNLDNKDKQLVYALTRFLVKKNIKISDTDQALSALDAKDDQGNSLLLNNIKEINKKLPKDNQISLDNIAQVFANYKEAVKSFKKNEKVKEKIEKPTEKTTITPSTTQNIFSNPNVEDIKVVDPEYTLDEDTYNINDASISDHFNEALKVLLNSEGYNIESKLIVLNDIKEIARIKYENLEDAKKAIISLSDNYKPKVGGDIMDQAKSLIARISVKANKSHTSNETPSTPNNPAPSRIGLQFLFGDDPFINSKLEEWETLEYLRDNTIPREPNKENIYFTSIKDEESGNLYVVTLVEYSEGPIMIGNKKYQPIGIIEKSEDISVSKLYEQAPESVGKLMSFGNRLIKSSVLTQSILKFNKEKGKDTPVITAVQNSLTEQEKKKSENIFKKSEILKTKIKEFVNKLTTRVENTRVELVYNLTQKKDGKGTPIPVLTRQISETSNKEGINILKILQEGNLNNIKFFNSFTKGFCNILEELGKVINISDLIWAGSYFKDKKGDILDINTPINTRLKRFIYSQEDFSIHPVIDESEGKLIGIELHYMDQNLGVIVKNTDDPSNIKENAVNILKNLLLVKNNKNENNIRGGLNWQIDKPKENISDKTRERWEEIITNDDVLFISIDNTNPLPQSLEIDSPKVFRNGNIPSNPTIENPSKRIYSSGNEDNRANTKDGKVDVDTGLHDGKPSTPNSTITPIDKAKETVEKILEDSKDLHLNTSEDGYISESTQESYLRVTDVISADEEGSHFDPNSPYAIPSTTIGDSVDTFMRGITYGIINDNNIDTESKNHNNASSFQWKKLFNAWKAKIQNLEGTQGLTFIKGDVKVSGKIKITDKEGNEEERLVAGTLDLLAYDENGEFHIYDMKTHHGVITPELEAKWRRQLTLYKELLEAKYGIEITSINIIPIKVNYPNPDKRNKYTREGDQLLLNGKKYKNAEPTLEDIRTYESITLNIKKEKLEGKESTESLEGKIEVENNLDVENKEITVRDLRVPNKEGESKNKGNPFSVGTNLLGILWENLEEEEQKQLSFIYELDSEKFNSLTEKEKENMLECARRL